jgi:hypothetical protein
MRAILEQISKSPETNWSNFDADSWGACASRGAPRTSGHELSDGEVAHLGSQMVVPLDNFFAYV